MLREKKRNKSFFSLFVLFILLSISIILVVPAKAIVLLDEDYNSLSDGQALPSWTSGAYAQDDEVVSGSMAAMVNTNIPPAYTTFPLTQGEIIFEIWMKPKLGSDTNNAFHIGDDSAESYQWGIFWKNDEDKWWYLQDLSEGPVEHPGRVYIGTYDGNWHHFKVIFNTPTNRYDLYMDSILVGDDVLWTTGYDLSGGISKVGVHSGRFSGTTSYFDDLKVYTSEPIPEPTTIFLVGFGILGMLVVVIRQRRKEEEK